MAVQTGALFFLENRPFNDRASHNLEGLIAQEIRSIHALYIAQDRIMDQPNVGTDVHLSTLQCCVHSQMDWVGCLAAVVLVNEHRVFCDVKASGIPVTNDGKNSKNRHSTQLILMKK